MKPKTAVLHFVALLLCVLLCGCWGCVLFEPYSPDYIQRVLNYAETHNELVLGELFDFEWDVAYNDLESYGRAQDVKDLSGYEFEIDSLFVDTLRRFLFFKEGELVKEISYWFRGTFEFPGDILVFYPDTVFTVNWYDVVNSGVAYPHLVLRVKDGDALPVA